MNKYLEKLAKTLDIKPEHSADADKVYNKMIFGPKAKYPFKPYFEKSKKQQAIKRPIGGAILGGLTGAAVGGAIANPHAIGKGQLIGAGIGAVAGAITGHATRNNAGPSIRRSMHAQDLQYNAAYPELKQKLQAKGYLKD